MNKYIAKFRDTIVWTKIITLQGTLFFGSDKSSRKANVRSFGKSLSTRKADVRSNSNQR